MMDLSERLLENFSERPFLYLAQIFIVKKQENLNPYLSLSDRTYVCPICENKIDRNLNSAINILNEGLRNTNILIP